MLEVQVIMPQGMHGDSSTIFHVLNMFFLIEVLELAWSKQLLQRK